MTDFTNCPIVPGRAYNGANGSKIAVEYGGGIYMLKFPPSGERKPTNLSYTNSCISEHLASSIFNLIGINAQKTELVTFSIKGKTKVVCACKDFAPGSKRLFDFCSIKNTILDSDSNGSGWQSWAQEYLEQGTIADRLIENMEPDTEYLVYAYGVDPITIERLTPISKKTLTTLAPQTIDTKFDIQIVSTEGLNIDVLVKANDYDGHFVAKIYGSVDAADTDATVLEKISESWIDNVQIYGWMGYTAEMILSQYTFQQSREIQETLEPNSKYYIYAFAVDDEALRCSDIVFIPITTNDTSIQH